MDRFRDFFAEWMRQLFVVSPFCTFLFVVIPLALIVWFWIGGK